MRRILSVLLLAAAPAIAQTLGPPKPFSFALADHPGFLHLAADNFKVTELSAKSNGKEFGIRAVDKASKLSLLGFLFVWPEAAPLTSAGCRDRMIRDEAVPPSYRKVTGQRELKSSTGVDIAIIEYDSLKAPAAFSHISRAFIAKGDLCTDLNFSAATPITPASIDPLLATLVFDADRKPDFFAKYLFATVLFDHHAVQAAGPVYENALLLVDQTGDAKTWRRVTTDQASMSYGMAGNLAKSRALNEAAIAKDPAYPLYYYNLACADAESGDATAARTHLQQASDRRANTLKGEKLPDPTKDDSIQKLKSDKAFWAFVQSLPKS